MAFMYIGVDYYPEHWKQKRWNFDARWMKKAGFNVVRLAEFAWAFMEPEEGRHDFAWLDKALGLLHKHGISVILCTPTAVMPAWCARKYPETLAMQKDGTRIVWGMRKNNCFTAGAYRLLSERITRAMAEHFADAPNVIGWQTDNEFGHPVCYCATCRQTFQEWLRRKYRDLAGLNKAWGTHFWGQVYRDWDEIPIPTDNGSHNPGACLDWQRFFSWLNVRFQGDQVNILRKVCPKHFVTHNFMGLFSDLNYYDLAKDLDHVSWDNYPVCGKPDIRYGAAAGADVMRGLKKKNFWIMEQSAGPGGWGSFGRNPRPGEIRGVAYQQLARGADGTIWFRWRSCTAGREQYWHGLLGHDGRPLRRYNEAAQTAREFHHLTGELEGTTVKADVAMIYDYDSIWALRIQPGFGKNDYHQAMHRYYNALFRAGMNVDMIKPTDDFSKYRVVLAPDLHVLPDPVAHALGEFVRGGGHLLTDCRTGVKTATNLCHERTLPGLLSGTLGITIQEYDALPDNEACVVQGLGPLKGSFHALYYSDWIKARRAEKLAGYESWHMTEFAAATRNRFGKGLAYYVGTVVQEETFYDLLIAEVLRAAALRPIVRPPLGVEVSVRQARGRKYLFLINHTEARQTVKAPPGRKELLTGKLTGNNLTLGAFGVAVIKL
jgi:beta-galactosidase